MAQISRVRIQNYKSIIDSGWVDINSDITTIVGPNEAGKTNFLEALSSVFREGPYTEEELCLYNKKEWGNKDKSTIPIVSVEFTELSPSKAPYLFVEPLLQNPDLTEVSDQQMVITKFADGHKSIILDDRSTKLEKFISEMEEKINNNAKVSNDEGRDKIKIFEKNTETLYEFYIDELENNNWASQVWNTLSGLLGRVPEVERNLPRFNLIEEIGVLSASASFEELAEGANQPYKELLEHAELRPSQTGEHTIRTIHQQEKKTEENLTLKMAKFWKQANLDLDIQFSPNQISIHFYDEEGNHTTVADRSTGMRWFLSFFLRLVASTSDDLQDNVILLDDPGVHLHPEGHRNLLDAFENLAEDNQIIYCTHSPSLIDNDHIERIRVFEHTPEEGTTVTSDLHEATEDDDLDVLAPVRQSLGADISSSLFTSTKNVLVEGYTDKLYLKTFSEYFRRQDEDATFDYQTSLVDVDGSKTEYMVRFLDAEGYDYAVLLDDDDTEDSTSRKETLVGKGVDEERIFLVSDVFDNADKETDIEIEDLLPAELFCEVVAEEYPGDIDPGELVEATGDEYKTMPDAVKAKLQEIEQGELDEGAFDKGEIAETICDQIASEEYNNEELGKQTPEAFKSLIKRLSEILAESK